MPTTTAATKATDQHVLDLSSQVGSLDARVSALSSGQKAMADTMAAGFAELRQALEQQQQAARFPVVNALGLLMSGLTVVALGVGAMYSVLGDKIVRLERTQETAELESRRRDEESTRRRQSDGVWRGRTTAIQEQLTGAIEGISGVTASVPVFDERMAATERELARINEARLREEERAEALLSSRFTSDDWDREQLLLRQQFDRISDRLDTLTERLPKL